MKKRSERVGSSGLAPRWRNRLLIPSLVVALAALLPVESFGGPARLCHADCDGDGRVRVSELVRCVNVLQDRSDLATCSSCDPNCDGEVKVNELVLSVRAALEGCVEFRDADGDGYLESLEQCLGSFCDAANSTPESIAIPETCRDGEDNDGDTFVDSDDPGCTPPSINLEFTQAGLDIFDSSMSLNGYDLATPTGVCTVDFDARGPVCVRRSGPVVLASGLREIEVEIVAMQLSGTANVDASSACREAGAQVNAKLVESSVRRSMGKVTSVASDSDFPADSFFDVFFEVETPTGIIEGGPPGGPPGSVRLENAGVRILPPYDSGDNSCLNPDAPGPDCYAVPFLNLDHEHCPEPPDFLDHFKVYEVDDVNVVIPVRLRDQFEDDPNFELEAIDKFANPVQKTKEEKVYEIFDPLAHLTWYRLSGRATQRTVQIINQFGAAILDVQDPSHLLVPTRKNNLCPPVKLDHFKCYEATGPSIDREVQLLDQFDTIEESFMVREPVKFCNPVDKNDEGIMNQNDHLTCYRIEPNRSSDRLINAGDQFDDDHDLTVREAVYLCAPTIKEGFDDVPCGQSFPMCAGQCPSGDVCVNTGQACECQPEEKEPEPCFCGKPCTFVCPNEVTVSGRCVIESASLTDGECYCAAICPDEPPLCHFAGEFECTEAPCRLPCPAGGPMVDGFCGDPVQEGCLCTNQGLEPCP